MSENKPIVCTSDPWVGLQQYTDARIALGRCGSSLPLKESLKFKLAHARARDAVHQAVQTAVLASQLTARGIQSIPLTSRITDRKEYLTRPDQGRRLGDEARQILLSQPKGYDVGVMICDGLSAPAIHQSAVAVACGFLDVVRDARLTFAPVLVVTHGRVAIGNEIGEILGIKLTILLIGERPGLSSSDSLGVYMTYAPSLETTDESRNCISNIRPGGMTVAEAVRRMAYLTEEAFAQKRTGVELKDKMPDGYQVSMLRRIGSMLDSENPCLR